MLLCSKFFYNVHICNKLLRIKINHYLISNFLYYKTYVISKTLAINKTITTNQILNYSNIIKDICMNHISNNFHISINLNIDINLYMDLNIHNKTNTSLVTISQSSVQFILFDNTQKNLYNLISYIKTRTN